MCAARSTANLQELLRLTLLQALWQCADLLVPGNGAFDEEVVNDTAVEQRLASDRGGGVLRQPGLQSSPFLSMPVTRGHE